MENLLNIPKLGFGLMRLPMLGEEIDLEKTCKMVDTFLERGFTYFDTAYVYTGGKSEEIVKSALTERHPRESFQLATKMPIWSVNKKEDLETIFQTQLERTGAGYFDFYLLHSLDREKLAKLDEMDAWNFVQEKKRQGLIKHAGFSFHDSAQVLDEILTAHPETEFVQLQINYIDWESDNVQSRLCYETARKHNKPVIIMEPVKGGSLAVLPPTVRDIFKKADPDASVASWAVRFAADLEGVITVLSGMSTQEQVEDNTSFMKNRKPLSQADLEVIQQAVSAINAIPTIPCTGCQYCVDDCPQKIRIPDLFGLANRYMQYHMEEQAKDSYRSNTRENGKAGDCIACGSCVSHCPQHINIPEELQKISAQFDS